MGYRRNRKTYGKAKKNYGKRYYKKYQKRFIRSKRANNNLHFYKRTQIHIIQLNRSGATAESQTGHNMWTFQNSCTADAVYALSQTPGYTDFTNLYDEYKICGVKTEIMGYGGEGETADQWTNDLSTTSGKLIIHSVYDDDDSTALTGINEATQYNGYKRTIMSNGRTHRTYCRPKPLTMAYKGIASTSYSPKGMWIDCNDSTTPHYGVKFIVEDPRVWSVGQDQEFLELQVKNTYYIACRHPR